jgi:galacturonosyltransferase
VLKVPYSINVTGLGTALHKEGIRKKLILLLYKFACKQAKVVFFENGQDQQSFIQYNIIQQEKTCVLHGAGVNLEEYPFHEYPVDKEIHFLYIGRLMKEKGMDELLSAADRIKRKYSNVIIDIAGIKEDQYEDKIQELAKKNILRYHGYQSDVRPLIAKSHCLVLPSYHEGMSNTLLEAAAMGRPLITTEIPGCKEAVHELTNGILIPAGDKDCLYRAMEQFLILPYETKKAMGIASRRHMEAEFDKQVIVKQTIDRLFITE